MKNNLGVLLPVSSLPGKHGIGDFSKSSRKFILWLEKEHYAYWQILPLNPLGPGESPYMSPCSYAIDFRYIDLDELVKKGLLDNVPTYSSIVSPLDDTTTFTFSPIKSLYILTPFWFLHFFLLVF